MEIICERRLSRLSVNQLLLVLLVPMHRMETHPGCGASSADSSQLPSIAWAGMRRIPHCVPMRRMGTRSFKSTPEMSLVLLLVFWFLCAAWEPILDAVHPVQIAVSC